MFYNDLKHWNLKIFFTITHVLLEISSRRILERGDFVQGGLSWGDIVWGDIVRGDITLEPS